MKTQFLRIWRQYLAQGLKILHRYWDRITVIFLALCLAAGAWWGISRSIPSGERLLRLRLTETALEYLGCREDDGSYLPILAVYNSQDPLPREYAVTEDDSWCAVFGTVAALRAGLGEIIPAECSCGQQIDRFRELGAWVEADWYLPRPGDYIFYDWDNTSSRDSGGWPDHVGIVVQTFGPVVKVIEGNKDDMVAYR